MNDMMGNTQRAKHDEAQGNLLSLNIKELNIAKDLPESMSTEASASIVSVIAWVIRT